MGSDEAAISKFLDTFHQAAAAADARTYFDLFTSESVFIGTDDSERWTLKEFKEFALPHFSRGKGWTYTSVARNISLSSEGSIAWFDEQLDNAKLGRTRGSGVLIKTDDGWKVAQYVLSIPIPNNLAEKVVSQIKVYPTHLES